MRAISQSDLPLFALACAVVAREVLGMLGPHRVATARQMIITATAAQRTRFLPRCRRT